MIKRFVFALIKAVVAVGALSPAAGAEADGNSAAAHACQQDAYKSLVGTDGGFANVGQCVSYAARRGTFVTPGVGEFLIPAGQTATLSDTVLSACNSLTYGHKLSGGSFTAVDGKSAGCFTTPQPNATIGPFNTAVIFPVVLVDNTCGDTFDSTGGHARVTGTNPADVDISDSGGFCEAPEGTTRRRASTAI